MIASHGSPSEPDIYADKSALILRWLLLEGVKRVAFSLREVASESAVSLGLVQRIFSALVRDGSLTTLGLRTAKTFKFKNPEGLLLSWLDHYSIVKKCRMWTYRTALGSPEEAMAVLEKSKFWKMTTIALHSSAMLYGCKNTNLSTLEFYLLDPVAQPYLEELLKLEPQERGYEVLMIRPYYKTMLSGNAGLLAEKENKKHKEPNLLNSPALLTFLDLYNFPLRGREQAEFMASKTPELKRVFRKS